MGMTNEQFQNAQEAGAFNSGTSVYTPNKNDYTQLDFTGSKPAQAERARADARLGLFNNGIDAYQAAAEQGAARQAAVNIRGVGDAFAANGAVNSGAASAAFADAALSPYYQAQQQIGAMKQQAGAQQAGLGSQQDNAFYDRYVGMAAPIVSQTYSEMEQRQMAGAGDMSAYNTKGH